MSKEIYISSTPHETRLAIVEKDELTEIYYERENEYTLAGSIYNGRVTRVLPGMQSSFVDVGLERDAFLYITDFMEEAGDSADFESADGSKGPRREKTEGRADRGGQDRGGQDRGGRGRRDERPREDRPQARPRDPEAEFPRVDTPREVYHAHPPAELEERSTADQVEPEDVGEGSPGADGSRRWRGRRGRRRGRGTGEGGSEGQGTEGQVLGSGNDSGDEPSENFAEATVPTPRAGEQSTPAESQRALSEERGGRGGRRDRGDRGGRGREGERSPREGERAPREDRSSRGDSVRDRFAPRAARYGVDEAEAVDLNASAEPFILPGESLSKYKPASEQTPVAAPLPTAQSLAGNSRPDLVLAGWDGGATLPGESLSRRSRPGSSGEQTREGGREPRSEGRAEGRGEGSRQESRGGESRGGDQGPGRNRRRDRDSRRGGGEREGSGRQSFSPVPSMEPADAVQPGVTSQHEVEPNVYPVSDDAPAFQTFETEIEQHNEAQTAADVVYEPETDALPRETEPSAEVAAAVERMHETVLEFQETTAEYEPGEDASASYRVDPAGPSEFRQGASADANGVTELASESVSGSTEATHSEGPADHEFTTLQASGEMLSEPEYPATIVHENPAAPIEHEQVVQSVALEQSEDTLSEAAASSFAPGDGQLEEELLEDEDGEMLPHLEAHGHDDLDEETLEHGADLGSLIRDMSIDQITQREPVEVDEEDDDFEGDEEMEEDELEAGEGDAYEAEEGIDDADARDDEFAETSASEGVALHEQPGGEGGSAPRTVESEGGRRGRRDGRRGGRDRGGDRGGERNGADRSGGERTGSSTSGGERSGRDNGGRESSGSRDRRGMANSRGNGGRGGRYSMQTTDLPAISDLLKPGQEVLVQIAKEPIAKKGARITSHIALPGRFLVFMPTVNHVGVSRKIESDGERRRLKEVLLSEKGDAAGGFIVRTAASGASEDELRSDLRFLLNLWADIKQRSESSKSPALIYHDLNLVERILRDQVTDNFSAIWVDTEAEYERVLRFLQRFQPNLIRRVKLYSKDTPLFEQFGITEEINKALRAKVWLKSGGSIVINQTEALVAIDINTGKFVGKTARLEDTILKTNLDAIPEIVRQIRLRDLGGIIIIDFIDMDERKNRNKVMIALEEELKNDRAPSKVLPFNDFGLIAITRKRVKQSLERTLSTTCGICAGTGMVKAPVTVCNEIYIELRKMHKHLDKGDIMLRVNPEVVKQLKLNGGKWLQDMEELAGKTILVKSDPALHPEQFDIH